MKYAVRVVTRNFVKDFWGSLMNFLGRRIKTYEDMVKEAIESCLKELGNVKEAHIQCEELTNGALMVVVYGE